MLPVVMQDEYVYRRQTLLLSPAEYDFPNYLFSVLAVFSESSPFGFYTSIKLQNALAVGISVAVIYWALLQLTNRWNALVASGLFLAVPSFFQSSFYMPDMFLSAFLAASLSLLVLATGKGLWWKRLEWFVAAIFLGLALLSKPHALFFVMGIVIYATVELLRSRKISPVFMVAGLALAIRLGVGFLVAGPAGLNLLGSAYSQSLMGAPAEVIQQNSSASVGPGPGSTGNLFTSFAWESLQLFGAISFLSLGLLILLLLRVFRSPENLLVSTVAITGIGAIAAFETFISAAGDDHSTRILTRHLEYLAAVIIALGLFELQKYRSLTKANALVVFSMVGGSVVVGAWLLGSLPLHRVSDGALVVLSGLWGGGYLIAAALLIAIFWFSQSYKSPWPAVSVMALFVLLNFSAHGEIRNAYSTKTQVDEFAQLVASDLDLVGREVYVIANAKASAELFLFYTIPEQATIRFVESGATVDVSSKESQKAIFFPIENLSLITSCHAEQLGQFIYFDCWKK
jgi:phosphoglycerol transferase